MKLINQSAEYLPQSSGIEGIYKAIELAGRTSYLSWDKMTDDSAKKFVDMLIKSKHTSVLEHGTIYLYNKSIGIDDIPFLHNNPYTRIGYIPTSETNVDGTKQVFKLYTTTNLRVLLENDCIFLLDYICEPTEFHEKRLSVKVVTSRGISHELVRHRSMSFIQESQRYCDYSKGKFNNELTFIIPSWLDIPAGIINTRPTILGDTHAVRTFIDNDGLPTTIWESDEPKQKGGYYSNDTYVSDDYDDPKWLFIRACEKSEDSYRSFKRYSPQQARDVLPNATKTTIVITAFESDWREWFAQRLFGKTGQPHPDMLVLANLIKEEFEKAGVWEGIMKYPSKYE